jgi:hypothetical protein
MHNAICQIYNADNQRTYLLLVTYLCIASTLSRLKYGFDSR